MGWQHRKNLTPWNKDKKGLQVAWNKGIVGELSHSYGNKHSQDRIAWNRGKKWDAEVRAKISASHKGKRTGARNPAWKGGVTEANRAERTRFSKELQPVILKRDNYTCQVCNQYGGSLQVDHIIPWASHPELRFESDNCRTLCMPCHYYVTFKKRMPSGTIWGHHFNRRIA